MHVKRTGLVFIALAFASVSHAQNAILQGGPWAAGHSPMYSISGGSQPVIQDSGGAGGGPAGTGLSELLQMNRPGNGVNTAPYANSGSGPLNTHNCMYDGPTTGQYHYLCFDANAQGGGLITYGAGGGAPVLPFVFNINGINWSFGGGFTSVPASAITGQVAVNQGGTGQSTANAGFNALSPMTTQGDTIYGGLNGAATRLPAGTTSQVYVGGSTPSWGNVPVAAIPIGSGLTTSGGNVVLAGPQSSTFGGALSFTCSAHQWAEAMAASSGAWTCTQPAFSDLSGSATLSQFPTQANNTVLGNVSGGTATPSALGATQLTTLCNSFTSSLSGCVPASGGGTSNFMRADGTWANPSISAVASVNSLTGNLTLTSVGGTKVTSSGTTITLQEPGGLINKFRNGTFDVWQRGTSSLSTSISGKYTADGWIVTQAGAAFTCARASGPTSTVGVLYALQCVGGTSNTDTTVAQRIESYIAAPFATGQTVTVQFYYQQTTGSAVTPKVSTCYASAQDNFGTCTSDLPATSLTSCASGSWCLEAYTFTPSSNASNGYQVTFDCNTALTSAQFCYIASADIRITPGATNNNIPSVVAPPELRPVWTELSLSQRYFTSTYGNGVTPGTATRLGMVGVGYPGVAYAGGSWVFPVQMRAAPGTVSVWDGAGNASKYTSTSTGGIGNWTDNLGTLNLGIIGQNAFSATFNSTSGACYMIHYTASAEL